MSDELIFSVWPVLGGLAYLLVVCSLLVLAAHRRKVIGIHTRALESRKLRHKYLKSIRPSFSTQEAELEEV